MNSWANIVVQEAAMKRAEVGTQVMAVEKDDTNEANRIENGRPPARDVQLQGREGLTPPREPWSSLILDKNQHEADAHCNPENMRTEMDSIQSSAEGAGKGCMVQEGTIPAQNVKGTDRQ
jgi:hypothetical protein